jgi:hypothetical protein
VHSRAGSTTPNSMASAPLTSPHARPALASPSADAPHPPSRPTSAFRSSSTLRPLLSVPEAPLTGGPSYSSGTLLQPTQSHRTSFARSELPSLASTHAVSYADVQFISPDSGDGTSWAPVVQHGATAESSPQRPLSPRIGAHGPPGRSPPKGPVLLPPIIGPAGHAGDDDSTSLPAGGPRSDKGGGICTTSAVGPLAQSALAMSPRNAHRQDSGVRDGGSLVTSGTVYPGGVSADADDDGVPSTRLIPCCVACVVSEIMWLRCLIRSHFVSGTE